MVDTLAVLEYLHRKLTHGVGAGSEVCLFPCRYRVEEQQRLVLIELLADETDQICDDLAGFLVVDTVDGLVARVCDLLRVLGELDLRDEFLPPSFVHGSQLINTAEGRAVLGGDQVCADTPGVDGSALYSLSCDQVLIQVVGSGITAS